MTADFVPADTANYNTLLRSRAGNFVISKATPTATLAVNNSPVTYDGAAKAATVAISAEFGAGLGGEHSYRRRGEPDQRGHVRGDGGLRAARHGELQRRLTGAGGGRTS